MKREQRLPTNADFQRVRHQSGRAWTNPLVALYAVPNELNRVRVGITVGGRVGKAVVRNRVRRRIREAVRLRYGELSSGWDLVLIARPAAANASWPDLCAAIENVLMRAHLWKPTPAGAPA